MTSRPVSPSSSLRIEGLDMGGKPGNDRTHGDYMLADTPYRHNPDARIGDEHPIRSVKVRERQTALPGRDAEARSFAQHDAAHHAGYSNAIHRWRQQRARLHDEHIAGSARNHVAGGVEHQGVEA